MVQKRNAPSGNKIALQKARRQLASKKVASQGLFLIKKKANPIHIEYIINSILSDPQYQVYSQEINQAPFPNKYNQIAQGRIWSTTNTKRDSLWLLASISPYKDIILDFLKEKQSYEEAMLLSNYNDAESILVNIEAKFGKSLWSLENRLLLFEEQGKTENKNKLMYTLMEEMKATINPRVAIYFITIKLDPSYSFNRLTNRIDDFCSDHKIDDKNKEYLKYKIFKHFGFSEKNLAHILSQEASSTIIDKYLTLCDILKRVFSSHKHQKSQSDLLLTLRQLSKWSPDPMINKLIDLKNSKDDGVTVHPNYKSVLNALDAYTSGRYLDSKIAFEKIFTLNPEYVELYEAYAKVKAHLKDNTNKSTNLSEEICDNMYKFLSEEESSEFSYSKLFQILKQYSSHDWSIHLSSFISRGGRQLWDKENQYLTVQSQMMSRNFNPVQHKAFKSFNKNYCFLKALKNGTPNSATLLLQEALEENINDCQKLICNIEIPEHRKNKYLAFKMLKENNHKDAISLLTVLINDDRNNLDHSDIAKYLAHCYLKTDDASNCLSIITSTYLKNKHSYFFMPVHEIIELVKEKNDTKIFKEIEWPIVNQIYSQHFTVANEADRVDAFLDFMLANNIEVPSQIDPKLREKGKVIFFLKEVCVPNSLEQSVNYSSTEEMYNERIKICTILGELDTKNENDYISEIANLKERILNNEIRSQIDKSKIYVDTAGIKSKLDTLHRDNYNRLVDLIEDPSKGYEMFDNDSIRELIESVISGKEPTKLIRKTPITKESAYLLHGLIEEIVTQFSLSADYGIDCYVSTKIRHGTLENQLRSPFVKHNMLTNKSENGQYKDNTYWQEKILKRHPLKSKTVQQLFKKFSKDIDDWTDKINNEWLQIRNSNNPSGLLDYTNTRAIQSKINKTYDLRNISYESFVDIVLKELWDKTDEILDLIRRNLKEGYRASVLKLVSNLKRDINEIIEEETEFNHAITAAMTDFQTSLDKVIDWFKISESKNAKDATLKSHLNVARDIMNSYDKNKQLNPTIEIKEGDHPITIKGNFLSSFTDIFLILFLNIQKHSITDDFYPETKIEVSINQDKMTLIFSNQLNEHIDKEKVLMKINEALVYQNHREKIRKEGGSGLPKLHKILKMDLKCAPIIQGELKDGWLRIIIEINHRGILA